MKVPREGKVVIGSRSCGCHKVRLWLPVIIKNCEIYASGGVIMARIAGVDLPREKRVEIGLTYIYGIGLKTSQKLLRENNINPDTRVKDLTEDEVNKLREAISNYTVEGELKTQISLDIKRLMEIGCYRGVRHRKGLPVRGQNTKNNARTRKGPARTMANKKK